MKLFRKSEKKEDSAAELRRAYALDERVDAMVCSAHVGQEAAEVSTERIIKHLERNGFAGMFREHVRPIM